MTQEDSQKLMLNYKRQKADFLDNLQPDDFRNGGSFNQAEIIIDQLNKALYQAFLDKKDPKEFIEKAAKHLFREDSEAALQAVDLAMLHLKMKMNC